MCGQEGEICDVCDVETGWRRLILGAIRSGANGDPIWAVAMTRRAGALWEARRVAGA